MYQAQRKIPHCLCNTDENAAGGREARCSLAIARRCMWLLCSWRHRNTPHWYPHVTRTGHAGQSVLYMYIVITRPACVASVSGMAADQQTACKKSRHTKQGRSDNPTHHAAGSTAAAESPYWRTYTRTTSLARRIKSPHRSCIFMRHSHNTHPTPS